MSALLVVAGAVIAVGSAGLVILANKRGWFQPSSLNEDTETGTDEIAEEATRQDFHIPLRGRLSAWSRPAKVFFVAVGGLSLLALFAGYQLLKTGATAESYLTREVQFGLVAVVGVGSGIYVQRWFDGQIGRIHAYYERKGQDPVVDSIKYAANRVRWKNGSAIAPVLDDNRLFGLFPRFKLIGEDRELRGTNKPLDDVIQRQIPDHAIESGDGETIIVPTKEDGDEILRGPTSPADRTWSSPNSLSDERATQYREETRRLRIESNATKATNAELYSLIRKMRKKIDNKEYREYQDFKSDFEDLAEIALSRSEAAKNHQQNGKDDEKTVVQMAEEGGDA